MSQIINQIAQELNARPQQVSAAVQLLDDGATVPFVARYRKEATGGLDDTQLRTLEQRLGYLREMDDRRQSILKSIDEQGKLTDALKQQILEADSKTRLEDLYLPYRPKRRTKGQIAIEAGLEPLAERLLADPRLSPEAEAQAFINTDAGIADTKAALEGAKFILMERFAEDAELIGKLRQHLERRGALESRVVAGQEQAGAKFRDYFSYCEALAKIPSHRALALLRGRNEGVLQLSLNPAPESEEEGAGQRLMQQLIADHLRLAQRDRPADGWLATVVQWTWRVKLALQLETELIGQLRERAEADAITVFAHNLKDLLMAAPAGGHATLGLDPGLRTGVKVAVVDGNGKLLETATIYPHVPQKQWDKSLHTLAGLCRRHRVSLISIGNGTASRETDKLAGELMALHPELRLSKVIVSEAGASVYSASELAAAEFPELDVSLRGAVSIARRLQDPLAELVKIDPKSIGVGQYQHDVNQSQLARQLDTVVEDCVNAVGVDVNTASAPLLTRVSGLSRTLAQNVVSYRDEHGSFQSRSELKKVPRLGPKAFEQCAGFMRIRGGKNPLDASAVHPEAYPLVKRILAETGLPVSELIGNTQLLGTLPPERFTDEHFGVPTVKDILRELDKPGRDPRPDFKTATFKEGVETLADLTEGMILEGVVTNVTHFGAFVDIGVHQDGLVHISALTDRFVSDPREVVKAGEIVKVKVLDVDQARKRIGLTMRLSDQAEQPQSKPKKTEKPRASRGKAPTGKPQATGALGNAMANAFAKAGKKR